MSKKIGFIGLGIMGQGMATNLIRAGFDVTLYNRTMSRAEELAAEGASVANTPAEAAQGADVVITMLADPPAIHEVILGPDGVVEGLKQGAVLVDCTTVDPATTAETLKAVTAKGAAFVDSPVTGSKEGATNGELVLLAGGDAAIIDGIRDVLCTFSKKIIHAGPVGSGTALKLSFNLMVSHMIVALSESMVLGVSAGLKPEVILEAIMAGTIQSPYYEWKGGAIMDRDFTTNFSTKLMHKDLTMMMSAGYDLNVPLPITAAVKELFAMSKAQGNNDEDFCSVVKVLEDMANVEVKKT
ncbi:MAG: NAD(P)-dependent oxidoreductase [Armatimonadota bacterium]|nr:NAD(P)-dependent oxidoreductase [bacterium]